MGVFDYLRVDYALPDGAPDYGWQTKDTPEQYLSEYHIREDGSIWHLPRESRTNEGAPPQPSSSYTDLAAWRREWSYVVDLPPVRQNITGAVNFYTYGHEDDPSGSWWEFCALYDDGKLLALREVDTPNTRAAIAAAKGGA